MTDHDRDRAAAPGPSTPNLSNVFVTEDADPFDTYQYRVSNLVVAKHTGLQSLIIADTYNYGRALFLDGAIQSAEDDEGLYHEMLVQPAMLFHEHPRDVLIIGGGEGACLREVLAHHTVRSVTMVDIDREAVELCREHLASWHCGAFEDDRVRLHHADGRRFLEECDDFFDVVVIDVVDMLDDGPASALYTRQFYELVRRRLRPGGILTVQALEFSHLDHQAHAALARTLRLVFTQVHTYSVPIPSFLSAWGFLLASDHCDPTVVRPAQIDATIASRLGQEWLDHLTGERLLASFALCRETRRVLALPGPVLEDGVSFVPPPEEIDPEPLAVQFPALQP